MYGQDGTGPMAIFSSFSNQARQVSAQSRALSTYLEHMGLPG